MYLYVNRRIYYRSSVLGTAAVVYEAAELCQQFLYLFGCSPHFEPVTALLGVTVEKRPPAEASGSMSWPYAAYAAFALLRLVKQRHLI